MTDKTRTPRDLETREEVQERPSWKPTSLLPVPNPREGIVFRWVRSTMVGKDDNANVSKRFREGWEPVAAKDFPELKIMNDQNSRFPENIEVGGLILCQAPKELMDQRKEYYGNMAQNQMRSVDESYLRENDARMPMLAPERKSRVSSSGND